MPLTKAQAAELRSTRKPPTATVPTKDFGDVIVGGMPHSTRVAFFRDQGIDKDKPLPITYWAAFVVRCCIDETGERLWADEDSTWIDGFPDAVTDLYAKARELSGLSNDAVDAEKKTS